MNAPLELAAVQGRFYAAMLGDDAAPLVACLKAPHSPCTQAGITAYRRSILGTLTHALSSTYPVLERIVGTEFFHALALAYVQAHPSRSGDLNAYGGAFARFVATWPPASTLPYLTDVAQLEWLVQTVYYAADDSLDLAALQTATEPGALRLRLACAMARIDSGFPLAAIWRVHAPGYSGDMSVDFSRPAQVLIHREQGDVVVDELSTGMAALIDALTAGETLEAAAQRAVNQEPELDHATALAWLLRKQIIVGVMA